jgi:hypothetical protein
MVDALAHLGRCPSCLAFLGYACRTGQADAFRAVAALLSVHLAASASPTKDGNRAFGHQESSMLNLDVASPAPRPRCGCSQKPFGPASAREVEVSLCRRHSTQAMENRLHKAAERIGLATLVTVFAA